LPIAAILEICRYCETHQDLLQLEAEKERCREAAISGVPDEQVLDYARQQNRVIFTRNCNDFRELHQLNSVHPGILSVYQEADRSKNMSRRFKSEAHP
jgi:predicted nuclease of predicted toxin-antitoxin system